MTTATANATTDKKAKGNAAAVSGDNAKAKSKGGNDGMSPRSMRGAVKPAVEWSASQEEAFAKMQAQREQARLIRATGLGKVLDLLMANIQPTLLREGVPAKAAVLNEENGQVIEPAVDAVEPVTELLASRDELLANIEANGGAILTHLSTFFKLDPALLKQIEAGK